MKKFTKILGATLISAVSATAIGCSSTNSKVAKNIDRSMAEFVSSINNLDYVETNQSNTTSNEKIGKIVETSSASTNKLLTNKIKSNGIQSQFLNDELSDLEIENTITRPSERSDNFKLFVLSESPFISLTSDDNSASLNFNIKFSTNKIEETSDEINTKINTLILKRSILMIYVNEIYNGNVNLSDENKIAINAYVNVIKENTSFLNGNRGMVKNQLSLASDLVSNESNENLINYYIIKSGEALETRANKIDSTISAIDSIIQIIESNLTESSNYYNTKLSSTYDNIISNLNSETNSNDKQTEISKDSTNKEIADSIADSLNFLSSNSSVINQDNANNSSNQPSLDSNQNNSSNQTNNQTNQQNLPLINNNLTPAENLNSPIKNTITNNNPSATLNNVEPKPQITTERNQNTLIKNNNEQKINNNRSTGFVPNQQNYPQNQLNNNIQNNEQNQSVSRARLNRRRVRNNARNVAPNQGNNQTQTLQNDNLTKNNTNEPDKQELKQNRENSPILNSNSNNPNTAKSVTNMIDNKERNEKFLRADRTPEESSKEEFSSTSIGNKPRQITNDASRVPYRTHETFNKN